MCVNVWSSGASSGSVSISSKLFEFLVDGKMYVQVDTSANQNGEIRGQLVTTASTTTTHMPADTPKTTHRHLGSSFTGSLACSLAYS